MTNLMTFTGTLTGTLVLALSLLLTGGCTCGFDCSSDDDDDPALLDFGLSDALPEELDSVTLQVESITFRNTGGDVVVETFTVPALGLENVERFQLDLLDYTGLQQLVVIEDLELDTGRYGEVFIEVTSNEDEAGASFVMESVSGEVKPLNLGSASGLTLEGFTLTAGDQAYTAEFELAQSLEYLPADDSYRLSADGIRVVNSRDSASLSGIIDTALFDQASPCDEKPDPLAGNRVYLYEGTGFTLENLADVFRSSSATDIPADAVAPFAVGQVVENAPRGTWEYFFGFLPAGDYTLAFACNTAEDDPVDYNALTIPLPGDQVIEIRLAESEAASCDLNEDTQC